MDKNTKTVMKIELVWDPREHGYTIPNAAMEILAQQFRGQEIVLLHNSACSGRVLQARVSIRSSAVPPVGSKNSLILALQVDAEAYADLVAYHLGIMKRKG